MAAVNPMLTAGWQQSSGATKNADYSRTPSYYPSVDAQVQRQALTYKDLIQLSGVNISGEAIALYVNGNIEGVNRPDVRGGDLFSFADGTTYLVVHVLENWNASAGWTKVAAVRQLN